MRLPLSAVLVLALGLVAPVRAAAQTVAVHQAAPVAATTPTPAKGLSSAIIPGSPLAAITGTGAAANAATPDASTPAPFGTDNLGLSITTAIGEEAAGTLGEFVHAVERSTRLTPVWLWLQSFSSDAGRRAEAAAIFMGLAICILPALAVEAAIRFGLSRPRKFLAARAARRFEAEREIPPEAEGIASAEAGETEPHPRRRLSFRSWSHRLILAFLHFLLAVLPVLGFAVSVGVMLSAGWITMREARLGVIGFANAYLFCRLTLEVLRFLLAPRESCLRLIHCSDFRAGWVVKWVRRMLGIGTFGYAAVSIAEILGLSHDGGLVVLRLVALVIHVGIAIMIWQSRRVVGRWIAGNPRAEGVVATGRHRLGKIWHFLALFYILALWIAYAGGVQNAFGVLLRAILVFLGALTLGRMAWAGSSNLLERLFPDATRSGALHPAFFTRVRAYNPLIRVLIRIVIGFAMLVLILQGWGINAFTWLLNDKFSRSLISAFISIIITVGIALLIWEIANAWINSRIDRLTSTGRTRQAARLRTLLPMLKASIGVSIFLIAGLICLSKIGVNAAPLLAGAGVLGIAIGFGSQKLVQDIITGLFLLLEDAMQVGDVISLASMTGTVERLSIRTIRLRGGDGSVNIIPFSAVTTVTNMTRDFGYAQISIQVGYEEDLARVYAVLTDIGRTMRAEPAWKAMMRDDLQIFGLDQFGASALVITGQIRTGPGQHWAVRREFNARVKRRFEEEHIEMPYTYLPPPPPPPPAPALTEPHAKPSENPPSENPLPD